MAEELEDIKFISYEIPEFTFDEALAHAINHTKLNPIIQEKATAFYLNSKNYKYKFNITKSPKNFSASYMYGRCKSETIGFKDNKCDSYYNYVIGYMKCDPGKLILRTGFYDTEAAVAAVNAAVAVVKAKNKKTTNESVKKKAATKAASNLQSNSGIKHLHLACVDLNIVFSGVMIVKYNNSNYNAYLTPMSGTWNDIMDIIVKEKNNNIEKNLLKKSLNLINIICSSYAIYKAQQSSVRQSGQQQNCIQQPYKKLKLEGCQEECQEGQKNVYFLCKYAKATGLPECQKKLTSIFMKIPININIDYNCLSSYLNGTQTDETCYSDIPKLLNNLRNEMKKCNN
jgi:hypothetical protein